MGNIHKEGCREWYSVQEFPEVLSVFLSISNGQKWNLNCHVKYGDTMKNCEKTQKHQNSVRWRLISEHCEVRAWYKAQNCQGWEFVVINKISTNLYKNIF